MTRDDAHRNSPSVDSETARTVGPPRWRGVANRHWRPERMKMRRTLGVSLAIFAISAAMPAKQAHSGDRPSEQGAKAAKPAKAEAPAPTRAAGQRLAGSQLAAARIEQSAAPPARASAGFGPGRPMRRPFFVRPIGASSL